MVDLSSKPKDRHATSVYPKRFFVSHLESTPNPAAEATGAESVVSGSHQVGKDGRRVRVYGV